MRTTWDETWMGVADKIGGRSLCDRRQIGAVLVDCNNRPISTGYNGAPAGFPATRSSDEESILYAGNMEVGRHTNVPPTCKHWCPRARQDESTITYSNCPAVHAEMNAILFADRRDFEGGTIYVTSSVCWDCGKVIANSGLNRVVCRVDLAADAHRDPMKTLQFLQDCGLEYRIWEG